MKFRLVLHGEIDGAAAANGQDPGLTPQGRRQAAAMARDLMNVAEEGEDFQAIYTSPSPAARVTAEALSAVLDAGEPRVASELTVSKPEALPESGSEGLADVQSQAWDLLLSLKEQYDQQSTVVLVTQELTIRALVCLALGMPLQDAFRFELEPASLSMIEFRIQRDGRERTLVASLNDTCHVEDV